MGKGRNLAKLVIDKNKIDELSLHNALTAICDESNAKTDFLQIPLSAGAAKGVIGSVRLTAKGFEAFNGIGWISLAGSVEILHSVSGSIINNYQTNVTLVFDTDKTSSDVVFLHNGAEIARERITHAKGAGISHVLSLPSAVFYQAYDEDVYIFLETLQHYKSKNPILKKVKQIATGGSISQSGYTFTHRFTSSAYFNSRGTRYCNVHAVGGGGDGGRGLSERNTLADDNYISGGGGGGGHLSTWSGNVSGGFNVSVAGVNGTSSFGGYASAGGGGDGASYNNYASAGGGGGSGGGASNDYDRGWNRSDHHCERQIDARSGGGNGAGGQGGSTAGGGGGGNSGHNTRNNGGGSGSWSSLLNQTVGRGGNGGTGGGTGGTGSGGSNYGDGGGGGAVGGYGRNGKGGAVAVQYTVS